MTRKQRRGVLIGSAVAVLSLAVILMMVAFRQSIVFFHTPSDIAESKIAPGVRFRLGGLVEQGSVKRGQRRARRIQGDGHTEDRAGEL